MSEDTAVTPKISAWMTITRCGCGKTEYEEGHQCPKPTVERIPVEQGEDGVWRPSS